MTDTDARFETTLNDDAVRERCLALLDDEDEDYVYALGLVGENEQAWYVLVVMEREHEGNTYLNERYAQLAKPDSAFDGDTFLKNGINRRVAGGTRELSRMIAGMYARAGAIEADIENGAEFPDNGECKVFRLPSGVSE